MTLTPIRQAWLLSQGFKYDNELHYVLYNKDKQPVLKVKTLVLETNETEWITIQEQLAIIIRELGGTIK